MINRYTTGLCSTMRKLGLFKVYWLMQLSAATMAESCSSTYMLTTARAEFRIYMGLGMWWGMVNTLVMTLFFVHWFFQQQSNSTIQKHKCAKHSKDHHFTKPQILVTCVVYIQGNKCNSHTSTHQQDRV